MTNGVYNGSGMMWSRAGVRVLAAGVAFLVSAPLGAADRVRYYHLDAVGNVRVVTDEGGQVVERHDYLPFGEECTTGPCASNPGLNAGQPRKFTGKERDNETGLDYFGARYYRASIGRFTAVDPVYTIQENLLDPQRWNRYAYARNNPLRYTDPNGEFIIQALVIGGAVLYALLASPDIANAPGPADPTYKSDQSGKLVVNAAIGVAVMKGLVGAELARPPDGADDSRLDQARAARDAQAADLANQPSTRRPAAISGGYDIHTGEVATGCSGGGLCAEDRVVEALGGDRRRVRHTEAVRPRTGGQVPVCERCEGRYGREAFPPGTQFKSDRKDPN